MISQCKIFIKYNISIEKKIINCIYNVKIINFNLDKISFNSSNLINFTNILINQKEPFYSRSSENFEEGNLHIYIPKGLKDLIWSPIPKKFLNYNILNNFELNLIFNMNFNNSSIKILSDIIFTSNYSFGVSGWLPLPTNINFIIEEFILIIDNPNFQVLGPNNPLKIETIENEIFYYFNFQNFYNFDLLGFIIHNISPQYIDKFIIYSYNNQDISSLNFLNNISSLINNFKPLIIIPNLSTDIEITYGYNLISSNFLTLKFDFPTKLLIPPSYHIVSGISYILSFHEYFYNFEINNDSIFFFSGLISFCSINFFLEIIGQVAEQFYHWSLFNYLLKKDENNFYPFHKIGLWNLRCQYRIKSYYLINYISNFLPEFNNLNSFLNIFPKKINKNIIINFLFNYLKNSNLFLENWFEKIDIPFLELSMKIYPSKVYKTRETIDFFINSNDNKKFFFEIPITLRLFLKNGVESYIFNLDLEKKTNEYSIFINRSRNLINSKIDIKKPIIIDGILFPILETNPRIPIYFNYKINSNYLLNILKTYSYSLFSQHEALYSLLKILKLNEDINLILNFFKELLFDSSIFFSLKCHILFILLDLIQNDIEYDLSIKSKEIFLNYLFKKIIN